MADVVWTLEDVASLKKAIASGVNKVEYKDKAVTYNSLNDMIKALRLMENALGLRDPGAGRHYAEAGKGLNLGRGRRQ